MLGKKFITSLALCCLTSVTLSVTAQTLSGNPQRASDSPENMKAQCRRGSSSSMWLDKLQANTHTNLCRTVRWVDGLFGDSEKFNTADFSGRVTFGARQDEEEGFDPRLRVQIKSKLPNVSKRFNAFIGRIDEDAFVTENAVSRGSFVSRNTITRNDNNDASWLVGLGYSQNQDRGFDASIGAKVSGGLNPYALVRYRHLVTANTSHYLNLTQTAFWRNDERYGLSSSLDYSYTLGEKDVLGWGVGAKYTTKDDFLESKSAVTWYHKFEKKRGIASRIFIRDSDEYSASFPEYGASLTYRRPFLRDWSFIEFGAEYRWEKKQRDDIREDYLRFGAQIEIQFGRHYEKAKKR